MQSCGSEWCSMLQGQTEDACFSKSKSWCRVRRRPALRPCSSVLSNSINTPHSALHGTIVYAVNRPISAHFIPHVVDVFLHLKRNGVQLRVQYWAPCYLQSVNETMRDDKYLDQNRVGNTHESYKVKEFTHVVWHCPDCDDLHLENNDTTECGIVLVMLMRINSLSHLFIHTHRAHSCTLWLQPHFSCTWTSVFAVNA